MIRLPEPAKRIPWQTTRGGKWVSGADDFYSADQLKQAILDALEEAAQLVEKSTYRKRWAKAAVNSQASNVPPCELATAIRKLKEDIQ